MKNLSFVVAGLLFPFFALAQNPVARFFDNPAVNELNCSFEYTVRGSVPLTGDGTVWMSGGCFKVAGNGIIVLCDGVTRWMVDEETREIYAESADDVRELLNDPGALLKSLRSPVYGKDRLKGTFDYDGRTTDITFTDIRVTAVGDNKKPFTPEDEVKGLVKEGYILTDLR